MHFLLSDEDSDRFLLEELRREFSQHRHKIPVPGLVASDLTLEAGRGPILVFARQLLPDAEELGAASITAWSERLLAVAIASLPEGQPWRLHIAPHYASGQGGPNRCRLLRESFRDLLQRKRRHLLRALEDGPAPFTPAHSLLQVLLLAPDRGLVSVAKAPAPFQLRRVLSPFLKGDIPVARDKAPPSRAFAKLIEAEQRLGCRIAAGETCVDLGASPGSWSYVALQRGARVLAVDRAPLRADLMRHRHLVFRQGNAFTFHPDEPVDWLLCDVIAAPGRSIELLMNWVRQRWARRFVVTIKFKGHADYPVLDRLKQDLPPLCSEILVTRLCANKNEACAAGVVADP